MQLDIRLPIGLLFTLLGALIGGYGLVSDRAIYERSLGHNVNLWWGIVLLAFGAFMLFLGRRGAAGVRPATDSVEGTATEVREREQGLEH